MPPKTVHGGHIYEYGGVRYPSVTTILSKTTPPEEYQAIESWRRNFYMPGFTNADEYVRYTAIRGTIVHYNVLNSVARKLTKIQLDASDIPPYCEWKNRAETLMKEVAHCRQLFDNLDLDISFPFSAESASYHPEKKYAGTKDLHARIGGVKTIADLKTSSRVYEKHLIQGAAYYQTENHWKRGAAEQIMIIVLNPKQTKAIVKIVDNEGSDKDWTLDELVEEFNSRLERFWKIPSVRRDYGI